MTTALTHPRASEMYPPPVLLPIEFVLSIDDREELLTEIEALAVSACLGRHFVIAELLSTIVGAARGARAVDLLDLVGNLRRFDIETWGNPRSLRP